MVRREPRWELKIPFAPSIRTIDDGPKHAVGLSCRGPNIGMCEEAHEHICTMRRSEPAALSCGGEEAASALTTLEKGMDSVARLSQSQYNCKEDVDGGFDYEDEPAALSSCGRRKS